MFGKIIIMMIIPLIMSQALFWAFFQPGLDPGTYGLMGDKRYNIHIMWIPKGEGKENRIESVFEEIVAKTFPNLKKTFNPWSQKDAK